MPTHRAERKTGMAQTTTDTPIHVPPPPRGSLWHNARFRNTLYQLFVLVILIALWSFLISNVLTNLEERSIRTGFDFLEREAGFRIGESLIAYSAKSSYGRAYLVGMLNTLRVALIGIVLATLMGILLGMARLSPNWLMGRLATVYIETIRNIPLLLQLFFWYTVVTGILPSVRQAIAVLPGVYLSKSGLMFPAVVPHRIHPYVMGALVIGCLLAWGVAWRAKRHQERTGQRRPTLLLALGCIIGLPLVVWLIGGAPTALDVPTLTRFTFAGGSRITPEFLALLFGLSTYTAAFIAENVRGGIQAVPWGQTEAASALGLRRSTAMRLVILPQALRIIIPPTTSQYLNLTKNSSLAVAIGYPDLVSVTNTSLNQTGQAIECIAIMMAVYLSISLTISLMMNVYNRYVALVER
jgi:general L-amino acid transport system permease protein